MKKVFEFEYKYPFWVLNTKKWFLKSCLCVYRATDYTGIPISNKFLMWVQSTVSLGVFIILLKFEFFNSNFLIKPHKITELHKNRATSVLSHCVSV